MISTTTSRVAYTGDGSTVAFPVPFPFFAATDLAVVERTIATGAEVAKALGTDYTVAGGGGETGTVTAAVAPASSVQWIIRRATARTQLVDFVSNDPLPAEQQEAALDRAVMRDQEIDDAASRSLRFPPTDDIGLDAELPNSVERAGMFLAFDANGNPTVSVGVTELAVALPLSLANGGTGTTSASVARAALAAAGLGDANVFTAAARFLAALSMESADAGAAANPSLNLDRLSPSPAANDALGQLSFRGKDDGGNTEAYANIVAQILDPANGSEDAKLLFQTMVAGALANRGFFGSGLVVGAPTGGDPGAGAINAEAIKIQNKSLVVPSYAKLHFQAASGTGGGNTVAAAWTKLTLSTEYDPDGFVDFNDAADAFNLPAGTYRVKGWAAFYVGAATAQAKLRLRNTTDGTTTLVGGQVGNIFDTDASGIAVIEGEFALAGTKTFEWQYWSTNANTNGLGKAITSGEVELYRAIEIWKVA